MGFVCIMCVVSWSCFEMGLGAESRIHVEEAHLFEQETDCILQRAAQPSK